MAGKQNGIPLLRQPLDPLHHPQLVAVVQAAGRLVHNQQLGLLRQCPCNQHKLLLAAGKPAIAASLHVGYAHLRQCAARDGKLLFTGALQSPHPVGSAHQHHLQHRVVKGRGMRLRDIGNLRCDLPRLQGLYLPPIYGYAAAVAAIQPQQAAEQRAFSRTVGAQHGNQLSPLGGKTHSVQNFIFSVGEAYFLGFYCGIAHAPPPFWCIR